MSKVNDLKKILFLLICILLIVNYQKSITNFVLKEFVYKKELSEYRTNNYAKKNNYDYVKYTDNFYPQNSDDIKNALYSVLDSGMDNFYLLCDDKYEECLSDVEKISTDYNILSSFNNLVHPYNSYNKMHITTNNFGKINIQIEKLYSENEIGEINAKIEEIKSNLLNDKMSTREKIKVFHDYIINNTAYDEKRSNEINIEDNENNSHKANGVLKNHIALCSGYTDLMAIYLSSLNIPNYKIATNKHIWNAVYLDNNWYHLDLTWDDPVTSTGENLLIYDFFLISTEELEKISTNQHKYDKTVYGF